MPCLGVFLKYTVVCTAKYNNYLPYVFITDFPCVTNHNSFEAVCLNRDVLWTALVSLHDRESAGLPNRNEVRNRYSKCIIYIRSKEYFEHV